MIPEIIIPFALPPDEFDRELVRQLWSDHKPAGLATLLSRHQRLNAVVSDDFARNLPHETWMIEQHGYQPLIQLAAQNKIELPSGYWFLVTPVHYHIATGHLVLSNFRQLELEHVEARTLFESTRELCAELGYTLIYGDRQHWLLRADDWNELVCASLDASCGHNIDVWSVQGNHALAWRKLQNEIQMLWHTLNLQEQRLMSGKKAINGIWLWGGTRMSNNKIPGATIQSDVKVQDYLATPQLTLLTNLQASALNSDWGLWLQAMSELENSWFAPLLAALKQGQIKELNLVLTNNNRRLHFSANAWSVRQFWRRPQLNLLSYRP